MLKIEKHARGIQIKEVKENEFKGQYIIWPLYRGYGNTIGNALRRVLLSSIPGAAIKGVRIDGVLSEFSVIEGVKEPVSDIILNIKEIVVKTESVGERKMTLSVKGPKIVTAADIIPDIGLEIVNPEQVICTITTEREIDMEFLVDVGEGFVVSEEIDRKNWPVDYIAVDEINTPIKKVSYAIETNTVELLKLYLNPFLDLGNRLEYLREDIEEEEEEEENSEKDNNMLDTKIEELDLTVRSFNCLKKAGIEEVGQLAKLSMADLLKIKNLGRKSLDEILEKMKELGFDLNQNEYSE